IFSPNSGVFLMSGETLVPGNGLLRHSSDRLFICCSICWCAILLRVLTKIVKTCEEKQNYLHLDFHGDLGFLCSPCQIWFRFIIREKPSVELSEAFFCVW